MPFPVAAAIAAGASIAGQGIQMQATKMSNTKSYNRTRSLMDKQDAQNRSMAMFNQEQQMKMWEATGPTGQMEQLKKAGLNPGLIYGMGGAGGQTAQAAQAGPVSQGSYRGDNPGTGAGVIGMQLGAQLSLLQAQKENIEADTRNKEAGAGKTTAEAANVPLTGENIKASTENIKQGTVASQVATDIQRLKLEKDTATFNDEIELVIRQRQIAVEKLKEQRRENKVDDATMNTRIAQVSADYAGTLLINELTRQRTKESKSNIQVNEAEIYQKFRQVAQGWINTETNLQNAGTNANRLSYDKFINDMQKSFQVSTETIKSILGAAGIAEGMMNKKPTQHYHETINYGE